MEGEVYVCKTQKQLTNLKEHNLFETRSSINWLTFPQSTMKLSSVFSVALLGATVLFSASAQQLADNPPSYFGAVNHQAYLDWISENDIEFKYLSSVYMPSRDQSSGAAVHWKVDGKLVHLFYRCLVCFG